jgi:hypothetical protein
LLGEEFGDEVVQETTSQAKIFDGVGPEDPLDG